MNKKIDNQYLISVIMPTYNGEKYIAETLESILNQTYTNLEIIIVDDCSTDKTVEVIKSYNDTRIKLYINKTNLGIGDNSNKALSLATGEFIMMQDHDDISSHYRAELQLKCLLDHPDITGVGLHAESFFNDIPPSGIYNKFDTYHIDKTALEFKPYELYSYPAHQTLFYRKSILEKLDGYYSNKFTVAGDLYFINKLKIAGASWILLKDRLLGYRVHNNMTSKRYKRRQIYKELLEISLIFIKKLFPNISDSDALMHAQLMQRQELLYIDNVSLVNHFNRILSLNANNDYCDDTALKKETVSQFRTASILANIYSPIKAYKVYQSIDELKPYTTSFWKFLGEYQKRFFRNLGWIIFGNERKLD